MVSIRKTASDIIQVLNEKAGDLEQLRLLVQTSKPTAPVESPHGANRYVPAEFNTRLVPDMDLPGLAHAAHRKWCGGINGLDGLLLLGEAQLAESLDLACQSVATAKLDELTIANIADSAEWKPEDRSDAVRRTIEQATSNCGTDACAPPTRCVCTIPAPWITAHGGHFQGVLVGIESRMAELVAACVRPIHVTPDQVNPDEVKSNK